MVIVTGKVVLVPEVKMLTEKNLQTPKSFSLRSALLVALIIAAGAGTTALVLGGTLGLGNVFARGAQTTQSTTGTTRTATTHACNETQAAINPTTG